MKIKHNEIEGAIEIKDEIKNYYFVMKLLFILNLINAILRLYNLNETGIGYIEIIWLILGLISLAALYFYFIKRSTLEKIPIEKIMRFKESSIFGKRRYYLELTNGKKRYLMELKTKSESKELRKLLSEAGIQN